MIDRLRQWAAQPLPTERGWRAALEYWLWGVKLQLIGFGIWLLLAGLVYLFHLITS